MKEQVVLPSSLVVENRIGLRQGILLVSALFLLMSLPWVLSLHELFRSEGLYAAVAAEYAGGDLTVAEAITAHAHNVPRSDVWPLYPAIVSVLYRSNMPMEMSLRIVSVIMLGILSLLVGVSTASRCGKRAGLVAACCCFGTLFALDKSVSGGPETMAACFLFLAQLLFFHYGSRYADWNSAWIASSIFISLGFLTVGPEIIIFFVLPLLFLRRPLSFSGKFRTPGFLAGIILLTVTVLTWAFPFGILLHQTVAESTFRMVTLAEYVEDILLFPVLFTVRMFPWSILMWMPFCVALQAVSPLPVYSRYLRTLFFPMLAAAWLIPGASSRLIFYLAGPLAVLTGLYYELGVRRYGRSLRKILSFCGLFFPCAMLFVLLLLFIPDDFIGFLGDSEKMIYRHQAGYFLLALAAISVLGILSVIYTAGIFRFPVWVLVLILSFGIGIVGMVNVLPYRMMENDWRKLGKDVRDVLDPDIPVLYKYNIDGMFCGLFYVGVPVKKLHKLDDLQFIDDTIYLISSEFPAYPDRIWTPLLPSDYKCRDVSISVWRGVRVVDDSHWEIEKDEP